MDEFVPGLSEHLPLPRTADDWPHTTDAEVPLDRWSDTPLVEAKGATNLESKVRDSRLSPCELDGFSDGWGWRRRRILRARSVISVEPLAGRAKIRGLDRRKPWWQGRLIKQHWYDFFVQRQGKHVFTFDLT